MSSGTVKPFASPLVVVNNENPAEQARFCLFSDRPHHIRPKVLSKIRFAEIWCVLVMPVDIPGLVNDTISNRNHMNSGMIQGLSSVPGSIPIRSPKIIAPFVSQSQLLPVSTRPKTAFRIDTSTSEEGCNRHPVKSWTVHAQMYLARMMPRNKLTPERICNPSLFN
jgi:hypothetical protein